MNKSSILLRDFRASDLRTSSQAVDIFALTVSGDGLTYTVTYRGSEYLYPYLVFAHRGKHVIAARKTIKEVREVIKANVRCMG